MNMKKRMLVLLLTVVMLVGTLPTAYAADLTAGTNTANVVDGVGNSVVTVDAEPVQMTVTVPSVLPASIDTQGNVTVATDAEIRNQSYGPVTVSAIKAEGLNGWSLAGADYSFAKAKVGTKAVQVAIDNAVANAATGAIVVPDKWIISGGDSYGFGYGLKIPAQKVAIPSAQPAKVIFTVDWYTGGNGQASDPETRSSLSLDKEYITMYPETAETIHATAVTETMVAMLSARESDDVTWETTNNAVAEVSGGKVAAREIGRTTVSASYKGLTATCVVDVREAPIPLEAIGFSKDVVNLAKGENETVLLTYNPDKFTGAADVTFTSSNPAISVQPSALTGVTAEAGPTPVTVSATGAGEAVITASATIDGKTVTDTMRVVVSVPLESLTIAGETSVVEGETITLTATKNPSNTTDTNKITWSSSDESIATVDADGVVTGVAEGEVVITAKCGGVSANWSVAVEPGIAKADIEWEYTTDDVTNTITLTKYIGESNNVVVHNQYLADNKLYENVVMGKSTEEFIDEWTYMGPFFGSAKKATITSIVFEDGIKLPTDCSHMFDGCSALTTLDVSNWDVSAVTNMFKMFYNCNALTALDVSGWDTSAVTTADTMFSYCTSLTMLDVSNWSTLAMTSTSNMFYHCDSLTTLDVSSWVTTKIANMYRMFGNCGALATLDLSNWDTSTVRNMSNMFSGCKALTTIYASPSFVTTSLTHSTTEFGMTGYYGLFTGCTSLVGGNGTAAGAVTDATYARIDTAATPGYFTEKLIEASLDWEYTTDAATNTITLTKYIGESDNIVVRNSYLVNGEAYKNVLLGMSTYTYGGTPAYTGPFSGSDKRETITSVVIGSGVKFPASVRYLFNECVSLEHVNAEAWDVAGITNMDSMFWGCTALSTIDVSKWNTSSVTNMSGMFSRCNSLAALDLSSWDTNNVSRMDEMFRGCQNLRTIYTSSSFVTKKVTLNGSSTNMFLDCYCLVGGKGTKYSSSKTTATYARIDTASTPGYFTAK